MTKIHRSTQLRERIDALSQRHSPKGDSSFRGITSNLLIVAGIIEQTDHSPFSNLDYLHTIWLLEDYLHAVDRNSIFREREMTEIRGYFPDSFDATGKYPHHEYIERALQRLSS